VRLREICAGVAEVLPYGGAGLGLARACGTCLLPAREGVSGLVVIAQGVVTCGENARACYERLVEIVTRAERYLEREKAWPVPTATVSVRDRPLRRELAELRCAISASAGRPLDPSHDERPACIGFRTARGRGGAGRARPGCAEHAARTRSTPLVGRDVSAYEKKLCAASVPTPRGTSRRWRYMNSAPRIVLDLELGLCAAGRTAAEAAGVRDIYLHSIQVMLARCSVGEGTIRREPRRFSTPSIRRAGWPCGGPPVP